MHLRKYTAFLGVVFLFFQGFPLSLSQVHAEAAKPADVKMIEDFHAQQLEYMPLNQPTIPYEKEQVMLQEFSFVDKTFRTLVGQTVILRFTSTLPADEVLVRIPGNGKLLESEFSMGETFQHSHGEYWRLETQSPQTTFELPVVFQTPGEYFITVDHDADHFYLEVEEELTVPTIQEAEISEEEQVQVKNEDQPKAMSEFSPDAQPVTTAEQNLVISEELIAIENERILEETLDPSNRSSSTVRNWSQFRSAWNSSRTTEIRITDNIIYSFSITGSSLNARSTNIVLIGDTGIINRLDFGGSSNILEMNGFANLSIRAIHFLGESRIVRHNGSGLVDMTNCWSWPTLGRAPVVEAQNINLSGGIRIRSTDATSPISVVRGGTLTITPTERGYITANYSGSTNGTKPISSDTSSRIILNTNRLTMGTSSETPRSSWHQVNATLSGVNGSQVVSSNSSPNDFAERYTQLFNEAWYSSLIFNGSGSGFEPPIQTGTVTAKYVDSEGNELAQSESIIGNVGTRYTTQPKDIDGWTLIEVPSNASGLFTQEPITVRYVYQRKKWSLSLQANPTLGGSPSSDNETLSEKETTTIRANPNDEYRFVKWEIVSGTNAKIANETAENTTFTMGNSAASVRAIYEKELTNVNPLDPLDPDKEIDPENPPGLPEDQGLFSIDFVSQFDFGSQVISAQDKTYYAKPQRLLSEDGSVIEGEERPNYVQISDRRSGPERDGWELAVQQNEQFHTKTGKELVGARLVLQNQQVVTAKGGIEPGLQLTNPMALIPGGAKRTLLKAQGPEGVGTWIYRFGNADSAAQSVALEVPKGAIPSAESYTTTLTWELSSVPNN